MKHVIEFAAFPFEYCSLVFHAVVWCMMSVLRTLPQCSHLTENISEGKHIQIYCSLQETRFHVSYFISSKYNYPLWRNKFCRQLKVLTYWRYSVSHKNIPFGSEYNNFFRNVGFVGFIIVRKFTQLETLRFENSTCFLHQVRAVRHLTVLGPLERGNLNHDHRSRYIARHCYI